MPRFHYMVTCLAVLGLAGAPSPAWAQRTGAAEVYLSRGIKAFMAEDYVTARRHFEAAVTADPELAAGQYFLGLTLLQSATQVRGKPRQDLLEEALRRLEQARLRDPSFVLSYLDGAIVQTILRRFDDAESSFKRFLEEQPDNPLPYLFLAVVHYRRGLDDRAHLPKAEENLDKAQQALERSGREDPSLRAYIQFYRGLIYVQRADRESARQALQHSYELAPDAAVGQQAKDLLERVESGETAGRRPWDLSLQIGWDWDSNVVLRGRNVGEFFTDEDDEDWRFGTASAFTYRLVDDDRWLLGVGINTFNSWHTDIDEFNVQTYGANIYTGYAPQGAPWLNFGTRFDWDYSLLGNDSFLVRYRLTPQIDIRETDWTRTTLFYQMDVRDYRYPISDERLDRDGITHAIGAIQEFEILEMFGRSLTTGLSYRYADTGTDGTEYDYESHIFGFGVGVPLPEDFTFDFRAEWERQTYDNPSLFDRDHSKRRDLIQTFLFAVSKRFNEHLSAQFRVEVADDDSNVRDRAGREFFTYDRVVYGLSVLYQF